MDPSASIPRCALVWLVVTAAVAGLVPGWPVTWFARRPDLLGSACGAPFDELLALLAAVALVACALWFWLVTTLITVEAALGGDCAPVATGPGQLSRGAPAAAVGSLRAGLGVRARDAGNGGRRSSTGSVARRRHAGRAAPSGTGHRRRRRRRRSPSSPPAGGTTPPNARGAPQTRRLHVPDGTGAGRRHVVEPGRVDAVARCQRRRHRQDLPSDLRPQPGASSAATPT